MHTIPLPGCSPTPLAAYLKALGLFRILSQQLPDSAPRAHWQGNTFFLTSTLDSDGLRDFLLNHYAPSPLVAPWNGGSGFYPKDNTSAVEALSASAAPRFATYRDTLTAAREAINRLALTAKPDTERKERLYLPGYRHDILGHYLKAIGLLRVLAKWAEAFESGSGGNAPAKFPTP